MPPTVAVTVNHKPIPGPARADAPRPREPWEQDYHDEIAALYATRYLDFPQQVGIETLARCNAACNFCPYPTMTRKGERMSDQLISKVLRDLRDIPADLDFDFYPVRVNEPFLDVRLFDILATVNRDLPNARPCLFSNASAFTDGVLDRLAGVRRLRTLNISFNDHRPDEYTRVMQLDYHRTIANIDRLHARVRAGEIVCRPSISRVCDGSPADLEFRDWVAARWPGFEVWLIARMTWMDAVNTAPASTIPLAGCRQWFGIHFLANGKDAFCCTDHDAAHGSGNVADTHVLDLYNRPPRRALRERLRLRGEVALCRDCPIPA